MRTCRWAVVLVLTAWVLWYEYANPLKSMQGQPPTNWTMTDAFETKQECEAVKARRNTLPKGWTHQWWTPEYSCWPDTVDPRPK
jgi:hypothetical protein